MLLSDLETPALLIDLGVMENNLIRVADYARENGLRLRPHTKTHKTPALARRQLQLGAAGLTVAKVGEAEVMLTAEPADILVAYPVIGASKLNRLMQVAGRTKVTVALDSDIAARQLSGAAAGSSREIGVLAEVDVGMARAGVSPSDLTALVNTIRNLPGLRWEGVTFYPGHIKELNGSGLEEIKHLSATVERCLLDLHHAGLEPRIVSGGSTPSLFHSHLVQGLNEIRPGTYIFNDRNTVASGACSWDDCAASILTTVVSTAHQGQVLIDGGSKTFSSDRLVTAGDVTFGQIVEAPRAVFHKMNEEHGFVDVTKAGHTFAVGDRLRVIPNHICVAVNLHEQIYGIRGDRVEHIWKVEGRGKLQ